MFSGHSSGPARPNHRAVQRAFPIDKTMPSSKTVLNASIALTLGGALWGLYWIPLRYLGTLGLPGAWAGLMIYFGTSLVLTCLMVFRVIRIQKFGLSLILCGLFTGAAFSFYTTSLLLTDVVRSILLFYLTPIWSTILGILFLGERLTLNRLGALLAAAVGLLVVLGLGDGLPVPRNLGDWLALIAGMSWSVGTLLIFKEKNITASEQVVSFTFGGFAVTALTMLVLPSTFAAGLTIVEALKLTHIGLLITIYMLPMLFLTIWPTLLLSPGRVGLLLMSEVIVGVISAALFAHEVFGWREAFGSFLIISAAVLDLTGSASSQNET